jgi:FkbM family methyltransferase
MLMRWFREVCRMGETRGHSPESCGVHGGIEHWLGGIPLILEQIRTGIRWRLRLAAQKRFLRATFQNGEELIASYLAKKACDTAVCRDGTVIQHPPGRLGLAGMILEVWHDQVYTGTFYKPQPGDFIIDAGANIGLFSILVARAQPTCIVHAFEPFEANHQILQDNLRSARLPQVHTHLIAITGESSVGTMVDGGTRSQDHRVVAGESGEGKKIQTYSFADLRNLAAGKPIALFKCDIEGSEYELFQKTDPKEFESVERFAIEYHDNMKPGTLAFLQERLKPTHELIVHPDDGYGMLYATRRKS